MTHCFEFEWARFAEQVRRRELPGSARREAQEQAEFEAASKAESDSSSLDVEKEQRPESARQKHSICASTSVRN